MIVYKYRVYMREENKIIPRIDTTIPNSAQGIMVDSQRQRTGLGWPMRGKEPSEKRLWKRVSDMQGALAEL